MTKIENVEKILKSSGAKEVAEITKVVEENNKNRSIVIYNETFYV